MAKRTSRSALDDSARVVAGDVLARFGLDLDGQAGTVSRDQGDAISVHIVGASAVTVPLRDRLVRPGQVTLVVADLITADARRALDRAGIAWIDRRGHVRFVMPERWEIDADIGPSPRQPGTPVVDHEPVVGSAGLAVAVDALIAAARGRPLERVTRIATQVGLTHPPVSRAARRLREAVLLAEGRAVCPELFWATVRAWRPRWVDLARVPSGDLASGLLLTSTWQALGHGAPMVVTADWPLELYAPDEAALGRIVNAQPRVDGRPPARIALAPTPMVGVHPGAGRAGFEGVDPVVAALDLAADPGRGTEVLRNWHPTDFEAVW